MDLVGIMNSGSAIVRENDEAQCLRQCAEALVNAVSTYKGFGVVAASPHAERVLGAAMMLNPTMHGHSSGPSIVFDVNYASGTMLARAAVRLRNRGNQSPLIGIVLNPLVDTEKSIRVTEFDYVHVEPMRPQLRQQSECGVYGIAELATG